MSNSAFDRLLNHEDYIVNIAGLTVRANNGVFSPNPELTRSTWMILSNLPNLKGKTCADIGCGTGIIAIACALNGASKVIAGDTSEAALKNTKENVASYKLSEVVEVRHSNLFSSIPEKFDYVFANLPILDETWSNEKGTADQLVREFITSAQQHLNPNGSIYVPWGSFSDISPLIEFLKQNGFDFQITESVALGYTWYLLNIPKLS